MQKKGFTARRSISPILKNMSLSDKASTVSSSPGVDTQREDESVNTSKENVETNALIESSKDTLKEGKENEGVAQTESSQRDVSKPLRDRPSSCVFVASLISTLTDDDLCLAVTKCFSKWGALVGVKVLRDPLSRPYAFVQYGNDQDAKKAIFEGHNTVLEGRAIRCEPAKVNRTLYFSSATKFTAHEMNNQMEAFGEVEKLFPSNERGNLFLRGSSNVSRNWYVKFAYREDAIRAFANLRTDSDKLIEWAQNIENNDGEYLEFEFAARGENHTRNNAIESKSSNHSIPTFDKNSIFVGQLSSTVTKEDLEERFSLHGEILDIMLTKRERCNFAFIRFKDEVSAACALEKENHSMLKEKTMHVQYKEIHNHFGGSFRGNTKAAHGIGGPRSSIDASTNVSGVALAPPPINLSRRSNGGYPSYRRPALKDETNRYSKQFHPARNHVSSPPSNFRPSPRWAGHDFLNMESVGSNLPHPGMSNAPGNFHSENFSQGNIIPILADKPLDTVNQTPPPSVKSSNSVTKSYSSSSGVKSEKSAGDKENTTGTTGTTGTSLSFTNKEQNHSDQPYFYYVPSNEVIGNGMPGYVHPSQAIHQNLPHQLPYAPLNYYSPVSYYYPYGSGEYMQPVQAPFYSHYYPSNSGKKGNRNLQP